MQTKSSRGVQQHEVDEAADRLLAERARPTVERVRTKIGRGSPNTVGPMLEAWFANLAPRLGAAPLPGEGAGAPPAVRQAMDQVWLAALEGARTELESTLLQEREALTAQRLELQQARDDHERQRAADAQQETVLREALAMAKAQIVDQARRLAKLQVDLQRSDQERSAARESLSGLVQERDADRRRFDEQLAQQAKSQRRAEERAAAGERRLLEEIDRARQDTKQAKSELTDALRAHDQGLKELGRANQALGTKFQEAQIEVASLRERLAGAEGRASDLQGILSARRATARGSPSMPRKAAKKALRVAQK